MNHSSFNRHGLRRLLALVCFSAFALSSIAQRLTATDSLLFRKDHFSFNPEFGVNNIHETESTGSEHLQFYTNRRLGFNLGYTFNFTPRYGLLLSSGLTLQTSDTRLPQSVVSGPGGRNSFVTLYSNTSAAFVYRIPVAQRYLLQLKAGAGFSKCMFRDYKNTIQTMTIYAGNPGAIQESKVIIDHTLLSTFGTVGASISHILPNNDLLSFNVGFDYYFSPLYKGWYEFQNKTSTGTFENAGANLIVGLGYTFTRGSHVQRTVKDVETGSSEKESKRNFRKEKRFIDPKSTFAGISGGYYVNMNKLTSGGEEFIEKYSRRQTGSVQIWIEQGIKKDWYAEAGYHAALYKSGFNVEGSPVYYATKNVGVSQLYAGIGKRLIGKNNYPWLNISTGVGVNVHKLSKGINDTMWGARFTYPQEDTSFYFESKQSVVRTVFPTLHLGVSKDFQLTKALYFSVAYRLQLGLVTVAEQLVNYREEDGVYKKAVVTLNGTSHSLHFGVKYRFLVVRE